MGVELIKQKHSRLILIIAALLLLPTLIYAAKNLTPVPPTSISTVKKPVPAKPLPPPKLKVAEPSEKSPRERLMEKIENRAPLSVTDEYAKGILVRATPPDGVLHATQTIKIEYSKTLDLFKVEILTTDIEAAKAEGVAWFLDHDISQKGICDLPLQFYLNYEVTQHQPELKNLFNPLPPGCETE